MFLLLVWTSRWPYTGIAANLKRVNACVTTPLWRVHDVDARGLIGVGFCLASTFAWWTSVTIHNVEWEYKMKQDSNIVFYSPRCTMSGGGNIYSCW